MQNIIFICLTARIMARCDTRFIKNVEMITNAAISGAGLIDFRSICACFSSIFTLKKLEIEIIGDIIFLKLVSTSTVTFTEYKTYVHLPTM